MWPHESLTEKYSIHFSAKTFHWNTVWIIFQQFRLLLGNYSSLSFLVTIAQTFDLLTKSVYNARVNIAFIRRIKSRFCPHKETKTSEIFFLWSDSHFIVTACINQWIIVIFNNKYIMNKFWFTFFWAVESNCSGDCMSVVSFFNNDKKNIRQMSDQHQKTGFTESSLFFGAKSASIILD